MQGFDIPTRVKISQFEDNLWATSFNDFGQTWEQFTQGDVEKDMIEPIFIDYSQLQKDVKIDEMKIEVEEEPNIEKDLIELRVKLEQKKLKLDQFVSNIGDRSLIEKIEVKIVKLDKKIQKCITTIDDFDIDLKQVTKKFDVIKEKRKEQFDKTYSGVVKVISAVYKDLTSDDVMDEYSGGQAFLF